MITEQVFEVKAEKFSLTNKKMKKPAESCIMEKRYKRGVERDEGAVYKTGNKQKEKNDFTLKATGAPGACLPCKPAAGFAAG
ncbi:MAG TPA: hypothetical protein VFD79_06685 [Tissierellaceae bacterium]|nr:hypothetical protein [Tissierellaceae bacterium]